jgi:hypothetical protein
VLRAGRDQQRRGDRRRQEGEEEDEPLGVRHALPALRKRHGEEEAKQDLDARQGDAELVQELDQLAVESFAVILAVVRHGEGSYRKLG